MFRPQTSLFLNNGKVKKHRKCCYFPQWAIPVENLYTACIVSFAVFNTLQCIF
jgi:hypothetical protein